MATFGHTSIGASVNTTVNPFGSKFTAPESGTLTSIKVYITNSGPIGEPIRTAVYADATGSPAAKLAESTEITQVQNDWNDLPLSLAISSGTVYWMMVWGDAAATYDTPGDVGNQTAYIIGGSYPTWPDPFNEDAFLDWKVSIYAEYTPAGGGGGARRRRVLLCGSQ